jgi:hypothetical protein
MLAEQGGVFAGDCDDFVVCFDLFACQLDVGGDAFEMGRELPELGCGQLEFASIGCRLEGDTLQFR